MPVITRSQLKFNNAQLQEPSKLFKWFSMTINLYLRKVKEMEEMKLDFIKLNKNSTQKVFYDIYFDQYRLVTELFFIINQYLTNLIEELGPKMDILIVAVYNKIQYIYKQIHRNTIKPISQDEINTIRSLIFTLQESEKLIVPLMPRQKRNRKIVNYKEEESD